MQNRARVQDREPQPYAAIRTRTTMETFADAVHDAWPALFGWLEEHGVAPAAAPFIRYLVVDMEAELEVDFAVPVAVAGQNGGRVHFDVLPGGRYATLLHVGPYDGLVASQDALQRWAEQQDIALEGRETDRGLAFRGRVEHYLVDPADEPDPSKWEVELASLLA